MKTDFLVIGSGLSGLNFSLNASKYGKCIIATKSEIFESNTKYAQGGIAAVFGREDSFESHIKDTLDAGAGLCSRKNVKIMVENAPKEIKNLLAHGVDFDKFKGRFELGREGAHANRRILHHKDATGLEIENKLAKRARNDQNIIVRENIILYKLLVKNNLCYGALFLDIIHNSLLDIEAKYTVLATGGIGQAYKYTTNPEIATGDGIAAAFDAGADMENMEFVQFHPTALNINSDIKFLITEAMRGEGAYIINSRNKRFVKHNLKELAPRDALSREIFNEMKKQGVYLDITHRAAGFIKSRFPTIYSKCLEFGIDITKDKVPITPAAHFLCGGIKTDSFGRTSISNLFAVGECACTGVHGANRLASNSLLECMIFSSRAAKKAKESKASKDKLLEQSNNNFNRNFNLNFKKLNKNQEKKLMAIQSKIKDIMWEKVGIIRTKQNLGEALQEVKSLEKLFNDGYTNKITKNVIETKSIITAAKLVILSSLKREKSAGCFYLEK